MNLQEVNSDRKNRRKKPTDPNHLIFGKIPPQSSELEDAVIGSIMIEKSAFEMVSDILVPESFYKHQNQLIFSAMTRLAKKNYPINIMTVIEELKVMEMLDEAGGPLVVMKTTDRVTSSAGIEIHARIIHEKYLKREMIRIGGELISNSYEDYNDVFDVMNEHEKELTSIQSGINSGSVEPVDKVVLEAISRIEELRKKESHITGIPSGFTELDRITHGWQNNDLVVIAARPSMGKTAFALRLMRNAVKNHHKPVSAAFFSLEMSKGQLLNRLLSSESGVFMNSIITGRVNDGDMEKLNVAAAAITGMKVFMDDTPGIGIMELKRKVRKLHRKHHLGIVFIDYLQLMSDSSKNNREQEISSISRNLKGLAKELEIPVIALCQLSRDVEKRKEGAKTPQLSDLRESGAIEQDADIVMFLYRPEYYGEKENENGESNSGLTEIKVAKHRNGSLDTIRLRADLSIQKFYDWTGTDNSVAPKGFIPIRMAFENQDDVPF